ncbi:MAG: apolipoprotein N-acyltransferase [Gemmataceae bacterium]|nr:apolipoprotein N-acyltransferase [Gemmataceae bacterium]MDW8266340.1 apolipoprotein N-acyltransferase [Gemmataceae bacterium]
METDLRASPRDVSVQRQLPREDGGQSGGPSRPRVVVPALLSAALLYACFFPLAWGFLAWIAVVPLLTLVRSQASPRRVYLAAWLAGSAFFWPVLQWMRLADVRMYATWAALAIYCSLYFLVAVVLLRRLDRLSPLPLVLTLPSVWVGLEYVRSWLLTGFAWYFLGHSQHNYLPLIQVADLGGVYAVSALVAAVNAVVFEGLVRIDAIRTLLGLPAEAVRGTPRTALGQAVVVAALVGGSAGYGVWRMRQAEFTSGPRLALIQGNLEQRVRNAAVQDRDVAGEVLKHYQALADEAAAQRPLPDLVVWPETSYPGEWLGVSPELPRDRWPEEWHRHVDISRWIAREIGLGWKTNVLLGVNSRILESDGREYRYNSALLVRSDGHAGERYDKIHRVPFGEYVPLREQLPWMNAFSPYDFDYSIRVGQSLTRFPLGPWTFGVIICYEDSDAHLTRQYVDPATGSPPVDFLVNISNDGWFNGSSEHEEHLAICRFRAVECRRAIARAVNMGISAVIDGNGAVVALPGATWAESKKVAAVLTATVPIDRRSSVYAWAGDWLPIGAWGVTILGLVVSVFPRRDGADSCR